MLLDDKTIQSILLKGSYITDEDLQNAIKNTKTRGTSVVDFLLSEGLITHELIGQAVAESMGVLYVDLESHAPSVEEMARIPMDVAKTNRVVFVTETKKGILVATDDPEQKGLKEILAKVFPKTKITIGFAMPELIQTTLAKYRKPLETRFQKIIESQKRIAPEIIDEILMDALSFHASDIHFEPQRDVVLVRFRVDGVLQDAGRIPREYYENILNRIKVQSRLRIDEHFAAQDGSMRFEKEGSAADLRTSIVPTVEGEKIVLRVLAAYVQGLSLSDLGLNGMHQTMLEKAANKPFGMILVTGPTGSGKTTTLYALLKLLNTPDTNITTIEDPVEYKILGANQIQVNPQTNLTFAKGLRSIVRQDPDVILVGEIRDQETVEIAINAALTGHLLLSTFHANDASTAIPRLLDMGAEPFLLASTLEIIAAQRLVRKICEDCRYSLKVASSDIKANKAAFESYFGKKGTTLYQGKGCASCGHTGYKGRTAIYEFIDITPEMQDLILKSPSSREIWKLAHAQKAISLFEDGIDKVKGGLTTWEELLRVAEPPDDLVPTV
jgi:type IV pilus assembly protein PilB